MRSESTETGRFTGAFGLSESEVRVLGCLLEKQRTTPDAYPLTLNALRLACNQSTNRDPIVDYDDAVIRDALHRLERRGYIRLASGRGSRAPKYRHLLADALPMAPEEQAIISVLMLRGPQTPGELKQRAERMHRFADLDAVHQTLAKLIGRELVARLERRPGRKEERYIQMLEDPAHPDAEPRLASASATSEPDGPASIRSSLFASNVGAPAPTGESPAGLHERVARVEREVADLRAELRAGKPARQHAEVPL
jgi:uncharacterized protein YceH (UPF0502 family)